MKDKRIKFLIENFIIHVNSMLVLIEDNSRNERTMKTVLTAYLRTLERIKNALKEEIEK